MLAPDMISVSRIGAEVHRPAIGAPTGVGATRWLRAHRFAAGAPLERRQTAWLPPYQVHFRNENPLAIWRYPGAVGHSVLVGWQEYISRSASTLCGGGDAHLRNLFPFRKDHMLPVGPGERRGIGQESPGFTAQHPHNPGIPSHTRNYRIGNA